MNYYTVVAFKFNQPLQVIKASRFDVQRECLLFFNEENKLFLSFKTWDKVRPSTASEIDIYDREMAEAKIKETK